MKNLAHVTGENLYLFFYFFQLNSYGSMSQAKPSDAEPQQKDPYSFPSQKFYNSNSSDVDHRQYEATYDISIEVIGNSEMSSKVDENDVHNMQYETGYDIHNEVSLMSFSKFHISIIFDDKFV